MYLASRRLRRKGRERHVHEGTLGHVLAILIEGEAKRAGSGLVLLPGLDLEGSESKAPGREGHSTVSRWLRTTLPLTGAPDPLLVSVRSFDRPQCRMAGRLAMSKAVRSG